MRVGLLGAGRMGRPIAQRLDAAGHDVSVFVRRPAARASLEEDGLRCVETAAQAVSEAEVVLSVLLNDSQVRAVFLGPDGVLSSMASGATLVQHTTCDPTTPVEIAEEAAGRVRVLDAALSGGPHDIASGNLTLWVGGEEVVLDELRPLLGAYASPVLFVGPLGNGQRVKLVNNALFVAQVGLAVDAVRLAGSLGIDEEAILTALPHGSGASRALGVVAHAGSVDAISGILGELMSKDIDVIRELAERAGIDLGILGSVLSSDAVEATVLGRHHQEGAP